MKDLYSEGGFELGVAGEVDNATGAFTKLLFETILPKIAQEERIWICHRFRSTEVEQPLKRREGWTREEPRKKTSLKKRGKARGEITKGGVGASRQGGDKGCR